MANLVMGAMSNLIPKLYQLLEEEYHLQSDVKERISSLMLELELAQAALCKVAEVPWDQLDKPVQIWARLVRDASYDMEDVLDAFLVRVKGPDSTEDKQSLPKYLKKMTKFIKKSKDRRKISGDVKDIITHLQEVTERCRRYKVDDIVARPATASTIDPRLHAMYTQMNKLVGMDKSSGELMSVLQPNPEWGDVSSTKMKIVSIVGVGGLGKTTLAKVVYDKIKGNFVRAAFVPVGRNPDLKKILKDILIDLHYDKKLHSTLDERQLIDRLREFFVEKEKRSLSFISDSSFQPVSPFSSQRRRRRRCLRRRRGAGASGLGGTLDPKWGTARAAGSMGTPQRRGRRRRRDRRSVPTRACSTARPAGSVGTPRRLDAALPRATADQPAVTASCPPPLFSSSSLTRSCSVCSARC